MKGLKLVALLAAVSASFTVGFTWRELRAGSLGQIPTLATSAVQPPSQTPTQLFASEHQRIAAEYYKPVNATQLLFAGMDGMLGALGDPHTQFFEPYVNQQFEQITLGQQSFGGIGARLSPDPLGVKVIQVFRGGPAYKAGIRSGDIVVGVNGENVSGQTSDEIVNKIKGQIGTSVRIRVFRNGRDSVDFTIERGRIVPPSADGNVIEGTNIGYVMVTGFEVPTPDQFIASIRDLEQRQIEGLVIDMRDNGGGLLESAVQMLARFVEYKTVVTMRSRSGPVETVRTPAGLLHDFDYPVVVLINERSASAAEIFAGVLRDYKLATLVGEHTYGKASVQNVIQLAGRSSAKITIAHYALPSGDDISRKVDEDDQYLSGGIKPDIEVEISLEPNVAIGDLATDNQLQKAVQVIRDKNPQAKAAVPSGQQP